MTLSTGRERRVRQTEPELVEGYGMAYARNNGTRFARDERRSDAALLEAIVEAADHLALELQPYRLDSEVTKCACCGGEWITEQPDGYQNHQRLCAWALYDAARGKVKP